MNWKAPPESCLLENIVYTDEPGLYWQGKWGIRLKDDVVELKLMARTILVSFMG